MNAKSQLACGVPFSHAEAPRLPRILSRDTSTQSFHFLSIPPFTHPAMTFPFRLLLLHSDTITTDFGSLVHRYVCLLLLQRCIFQFAAQMNAEHQAAVRRRLMNPLVKIDF